MDFYLIHYFDGGRIDIECFREGERHVYTIPFYFLQTLDVDRPIEEQILKLMTNKKDYKRMFDTGVFTSERGFSWDKVQDDLRARINRMFHYIPKEHITSILDCISVKGYTVKILRDQGFKAFGFDSNDWAVLEGQSEFPELAKHDHEFDFQLLQKGDMTLEGYQTNSFDLVMAMDVLDTIPDEEIEGVMQQFFRVSKKYVYFSLGGDREKWNPMLRKYFTYVTRTGLDTTLYPLLVKKPGITNNE